MDPKIPEWLSADFLKQSLQRDHENRDITITDFTASLAAAIGNNYGSLVLRVGVDYRLGEGQHKLSIIVKGPLTEGASVDYFGTVENSEPSFYNLFLPEAYKLLEDRFTPYKFHSSVPSVIVMEDLQESGYLMADRTKQLDYEHCLHYTNAAAAFHSASIALHKKTPEMINSVCIQPMYYDESIGRPVMEKLYKWGLDCMANHISDKRISKIVRETSENIWCMLVDIHKPHATLNSLLQGDPWTTNMMFKYDADGNVRDVKLIDFQMLTFGPPAHDLVYFVWLSANKDVRKHHLRDLYLNYFTQLNRNLRTFGCMEVDLVSFTETVQCFSPLALATAAFSPCLLDPSPVDINAIIRIALNDNAAEGANPFDRYYTESFCRIDLPEMVEHLEAEGVFDYLEGKLKSIRGNFSKLNSCGK